MKNIYKIYIYNFLNALLYNSMTVLDILRKNSEELLNKMSAWKKIFIKQLPQ